MIPRSTREKLGKIPITTLLSNNVRLGTMLRLPHGSGMVTHGVALWDLQTQGFHGTMGLLEVSNVRFHRETDYNSVNDHLNPYADLRLQLGLAHLLISDVLVFPRDCAAFSIEPKESTYIPSRVY
ncbi:hypothetical protein FR483_n105L [Paramecium bursaria Chlorella virus FR483]|uniref:Uncharacterized protein n105L n=1 Tax=Paramecium bursaria Chlorella virus FR483 TaxID=399781 RepID=A7J6F9_PBCVF|nr:hypothetical protein FR483_n105L [Paramecium bursaria Chlorella virus FR483]ABT15390.1 hypothetical protein FR483_n105L [Paramecium bursaria Chlorella virus FR483]